MIIYWSPVRQTAYDGLYLRRIAGFTVRGSGAGAVASKAGVAANGLQKFIGSAASSSTTASALSGIQCFRGPVAVAAKAGTLLPGIEAFRGAAATRSQLATRLNGIERFLGAGGSSSRASALTPFEIIVSPDNVFRVVAEYRKFRVPKEQR